MKAKNTSAALIALGLGSFTIGTAELVTVGVLNLLAKDMHVSVSTAGQIVTAYALGIALGGPLLTAFTIKLERRLLLILSLVAYIAGTILAAISINFPMLIVARIFSGSLHGMLIGTTSIAAASLVPFEQRGKAIGMVFGGIALSTILGVPLGTLVGQQLGWRATLIGIAGLGILATLAILFFVPKIKSGKPIELSKQSHDALSPRVLAILFVGFLLIGGQFTIFTYMASFLQQVTGVSGNLISGLLLAYGIAAAVGTFGGARFADKYAATTLIITNIILIIALLLLYLLGMNLIFAVLAMMIWGLAGFGLVPSLQFRIISLAGKGGDLAATLGASVVNAGIAIGALVGGLILTDYGVKNVALTGLLIILIALPVTALTYRLKLAQTTTK